VASRGSRRLTSEEIANVETFSLYAELALGLAGFAGVTAAFGGRDFLLWRDAWPLFAVFSSQFTGGLYPFSRILIRKN
jgi:hypothetical protein